MEIVYVLFALSVLFSFIIGSVFRWSSGEDEHGDPGEAAHGARPPHDDGVSAERTP